MLPPPLLLLLVQGLPQGKLYKYDPKTEQTHLIAKDFWYSNGVAISEDESFLVISETDRLRLVKYWLKGPKVGATVTLPHRHLATLPCQFHGSTVSALATYVH